MRDAGQEQLREEQSEEIKYQNRVEIGQRRNGISQERRVVSYCKGSKKRSVHIRTN